MRTVGYLSVVALTLLCLGLHQRSVWRADRLLAGEALATQRFETLASLAQDTLQSGRRAQLSELLTAPELSDLQLLADFARPGLAFASDQVYVYGLAQTTGRPSDGDGPSPGYVLRAWPLQFGVSGDLQMHIDSSGAYYHGQNNMGRSGLLGDFPPPFPDPAVGSRNKGWWPRQLGQP